MARRALKRADASRRPVQKPQRPVAPLVPITEDDADGIISAQRLKKERRYSLDRVLSEIGRSLER